MWIIESRFTAKAPRTASRSAPKSYPWADPAYALIHASIVDCHRNLLGSLRGEAVAETTGADNLQTLRLVDASYESAAGGQVIPLSNDSSNIPERSNMTSQPIIAKYLIETPLPLEQAAEMMAGEQSSGTFLPVPGETEELKRRAELA